MMPLELNERIEAYLGITPRLRTPTLLFFAVAVAVARFNVFGMTEATFAVVFPGVPGPNPSAMPS